VAAKHDQCRTVVDGHAPTDRGLQPVAVVGDLADIVDVPAVGAEPGRDIVVVGELGVSVDGDVVVVVDGNDTGT
jgi:hypothetical protein